MLHFFMKPRTYTITLTVTPPNGKKGGTYKKNIVVTGKEAIKGFEVWHAPFHGRLAQYLYVQIPQDIPNATKKLTVRVEKDSKVVGTPLFDQITSKAEEKILLSQRDLNPGNYLLRTTLTSGTDTISEIVEKFNVPTFKKSGGVYLNENNALVKDGKLYFPISAWMLDDAKIPLWKSGGYINSGFMTGTLDNDVASEWHRYVTSMGKNELDIIGTCRWPNKGKSGNRRNANADSFLEYVKVAKNESNMIAYCWEDEPNIGGAVGWITPPVYSAWMYLTNQVDTHHLSLANLAGYVYMPKKNGPIASEFNFLKSAPLFGGKKYVVANIYHGACFALENYRNIADPLDSTRRAIDCYTNYLRTRKELNYNLLPTMAVSSTCHILPDNPEYYGPPTTQQMGMIGWLNIVYGVKGMNWYQYQGPTPPENFGFMAEYHDQVTQLKDAILAPDDESISVTDNANSKGNRVDIMTKKYNNEIYIFAVRVTETEYLDNPSIEPENITVKFNIEGASTAGKSLWEYNNFQRKTDFFNVEQETANFSFSVKNTPLIPGKVIIAGVSSADSKWEYLFDDGKGNIYKNRDWKDGGTYHAGTVNYTTGKFDITFINSYSGINAKPLALKIGNNNLRVMYAPKQQVRNITLNGTSFEDNFGREDVHIYILGDSSKSDLLKEFDKVKMMPRKIRLN